MSISAAEFEALQVQLIGLKEAKYESQDREKKLLNEIKNLKEHAASLEVELKKAQTSSDPSTMSFASLTGVMSKGKDKKAAALQSENEALTRNLELVTQEHKEQQEATMQMVRNLHAINKGLEDEIENQKKVVLEKGRKIEEQEGQSRKLQIRLIQYETSADINKSESGSQEVDFSGEDRSEHGTATAEEAARLRDNVRLLSEQLKEVDEKLSTSGQNYQDQIATLESQLTTYREKIKQDEISSAKMEARLDEEITKALKEKESLSTQFSILEEQAEKNKGLGNQIIGMEEKIAGLTGELLKTKTSRDEYIQSYKSTAEELENIVHTKQVTDAQFRELQIEVDSLRKLKEEHFITLDQLTSTKDTLTNVETALGLANVEREQLIGNKEVLERVRHELEDSNTQINTLQAELEALKVKSLELQDQVSKKIELENQLTDMKLANFQAATEIDTYKKLYQEEKSKLGDSEDSLRTMSEKRIEAQNEIARLTEQVTQLQTAKEDVITESKIEDRKNQRMIKELKAELNKERSFTSKNASSELSLSDTLSPPSPSMPRYSPTKTPQAQIAPLTHSNRMSQRQADTVNSLPLLTASVVNMELSPSTMEELLRRDLDTALTMVGKLGEDKWKLEEKARFLEENLALINEDLVRKTQVIQYYVSKTKQVVTSEQLAERDKAKKQGGVRGTLFRASAYDQDLSVELLTKMEAVLEETVLKNIQLQNDMATLGNETGILQKEIIHLKEENNHYKEQLVRIMTNPS